MISSAERSALRSLADLYGVKRTYVGMHDRRVSASHDATLATLTALGAETSSGDTRSILQREEEKVWLQPLEPVMVAWEGELHDVRLRLPAAAARSTLALSIRLEDGRELIAEVQPAQRGVAEEKRIGRSKFVEVRFPIADRLPHGYHTLRIAVAGQQAESLILSAPRRCYAGPAGRGWGLFAPLYATRFDRHKPLGDLAELEQLLTWTSSLGGRLVATLPMSAAFLTAPFDPSPYSPASRLYWNELFLDLDRLLNNTDSIPARNRARAAEWQHAMREAAGGDYIDYREVAQLKRHVLEALADWFFLQGKQHGEDFREFLTLYPDAERYARFRATGERQARGWPGWPPRLRAGVMESHDFADEAARYHLYAQFVMHNQLELLAQRSRRQGSAVYLDMPLGVHSDSFDVWCWPELFVTGVSAGAPPDAFFTRGQNWGFPPLNPKTLREQRYDYWRRVLRTQFRYAGMLRIDHVMSLHRLFFVPAGFEAAEGVYVRYPDEELYAVLTIESQRHNAAVVGEDLGTVPAEVRKSMKRHGVKRMFVVQFEASDGDPPIGTVPGEAVASLNTHDMPPFAAYWQGQDAELRRDIGLLTDEEVEQQHQARDRLARALAAHLRKEGALDVALIDRLIGSKPDVRDALHALLDWLARSPADLTLINLEDIWLEERPQNVPGTGQENPNWRRRLRYTLQEIMTSAEVANLLDRINVARQEGQQQA